MEGDSSLINGETNSEKLMQELRANNQIEESSVLAIENENPADLISKGMSLTKLKQNKIWWEAE